MKLANVVEPEANGTHEPELTRTQAVVVREPQEQMTVFGTSDPIQVLAKASIVASALKEVIAKQGLIKKIQGKDYPLCEAWTLLGTMLGIFPVLEWSRRVEGGWEARVEARTRSGDILGAAEAECLRTEKAWSNRDDYAIRSMAQTRATAKALRMPLGFVMTLAGFQPTPAEEMTFENPGAGGSPSPTARARANTPPTARTVNSSPQANPVPPRETPPETKAKEVRHKAATDEQIARFKAQLLEDCGGDMSLVTEWLTAIEWLMPDETLDDLPRNKWPATKQQATLFSAGLRSFADGDEVLTHAGQPVTPYPANGDTEPPKEFKKAVEVPRDENCDPDSPTAPWRSFVCHYGKGQNQTLGAMAKPLLVGYWHGHQDTTTFEGKNGKTYNKRPEAIEQDRKFREALDEAGKHYKFTKKDESAPKED